MQDHDSRMTELLDRYISLEKEIQDLTTQVTGHLCASCTKTCCREEICRESIESPFLSLLTKRQSVRYDIQNGWLGSRGCRLAYGRPLVCYQFFCDDIITTPALRNSGIQKIIHDFISIGNRAHGNTHLLCIEDLNTVSSRKIARMIIKIDLLIDNLRGRPLFPQ